MRFWRHGVGWLLTMLVVAALTAGAYGLDPHPALAQYGRQTWQTENGLPQNTVRAVVQARDGFIWMGTDEGLVRFDGNDFKVFIAETTPALKSNAVEGLTEDRAGRLWVTTSGSLTLYARGQFRPVGVAEGLPDGAVWFTHEDRRGRLWVATAAGLCVMQENRCAAVAATKGISVTAEARFAEAPDGSIWLADGAAVMRLDGGSLLKSEALKTLDGTEILSLLVQRAGTDNRLLVGTREGLELARTGALVAIPLPGGRVAVNAMVQRGDGSEWLGTSAGLMRERDGRTDVVAQGPVQTLFVDQSSTVWAGTSRGVVRVAGDTVETVMPGSALLALMEDREGDLWLGTDADGLTVLREQKFVTYTTAEGLAGNVVRAVLQDAAGAVWVGTDGGGLSRKLADGWTTLSTRQGLSSDVVLALAAGRNGDLWVGTPAGLNRVRGGHVTVLTAADGLADDFVRSLLVDRDGSVWAGTRHGLTRIAANGAMTTFTTLDGLGSDFVGAMLEARDGDLWIGTSGGLTRLHQGRFSTIGVQGGLAKNVVTAMLEAADGMLWLGTSGAGLGRLDLHHPADGITPVPAANLPTAISGVLEDGAGRLWIGSRRGIFRVAEAALNRAIEQHSTSVEVSAYDTADGMRSRECSSGGHPAAMRLRDGTLWFATLRGVSVVDPEHLHENTVPPLIAVETVLVNDVAQPAKDELVLAPGSQRVEFQYAGLSFVAPQKVEYRYWLEGFDPYWVEAGSHRAAFYTNLRPGRYVFHVAAANNDGVWSEQDAVVRLRVRPFFWQTWWFYALLILTAGAIAYGIYTWRVRRVAARYQGVLEERSRIAREIHDGLAQGIVSISLQLEVVTRLLGTSVDAARAQLDVTRGMVKQSLAEARSSIWDLRTAPAESGQEELPVALGRMLKSLTAPAGIAGTLTVTGSYRALVPEVEVELLKIAQEAVTNAVRHAGATAIGLTVSYDMKLLRLTIADDGGGFAPDAPAPAGHFGLQGMRERAARIRAQLTVASGVGEGTRVVVELGLR